MKVREKQWGLKEIGPLDAHLLLPTCGRINRGMRTVCLACGDSVTDEKFLAGFKAGKPNMIFHVECVPENERGRGPAGKI